MRKHKRGLKDTSIRFEGLTLSQCYPHLMLPIVRLELTQDQHAIIDPEDAELAMQFTWNAMQDKRRPGFPFYASTTIPHPNGKMKPGTQTRLRKTLRLHNLIMAVERVDHVNGNGLDNRRVNLRAATHGQNMANVGRKVGQRGQLSSRFKGVTWNQGRWSATIYRGDRNVNLGRFWDEAEAARAYDAAALELWGEFARTNVTLGLLPDLRQESGPLTLFPFGEAS